MMASKDSGSGAVHLPVAYAGDNPSWNKKRRWPSPQGPAAPNRKLWPSSVGAVMQMDAAASSNAVTNEDALVQDDYEMLDEVSKLTISQPISGHQPSLGKTWRADIGSNQQELEEMDVDLDTPGPSASYGSKTKVKFVMGFLKGCEKCERRVPGHYNHLVPYEEKYHH